MKLLVFDLKGELAHFRRPDTTATHASYPFITRTALRGLLGSILGLAHWSEAAWTGVQLLAPVRTRAQQLSLLGKGYFSGGNLSFNRPTSIELIIKPHYRIYYTGARFDELRAALEQGHAVYHTYLGSAFALTTPRLIGVIEATDETPKGPIECLTVVPSHVVADLALIPGQQYARAGGVPYASLGERQYEGTINFIYERSGQRMRFTPHQADSPPVRWARSKEGWISLW